MVKIFVDATKKSLLIINNFIIYNYIKRGLYPSSWKKSLSQFSRKDISRYASFLPISGKIFEKFFLIQFLNMLRKMVYFVITNKVFKLLLSTTFMHHLTVNSLKICEEYLLIYIKSLIDYGVKVSSVKRYDSEIFAKFS